MNKPTFVPKLHKMLTDRKMDEVHHSRVTAGVRAVDPSKEAT